MIFMIDNYNLIVGWIETIFCRELFNDVTVLKLHRCNLILTHIYFYFPHFELDLALIYICLIILQVPIIFLIFI